jgi:hypothetical protein
MSSNTGGHGGQSGNNSGGGKGDMAMVLMPLVSRAMAVMVAVYRNSR